jgi:hypothetical protein
MNLWRFLTSFSSITEAEFPDVFPRMASLARGPSDVYLWIDQICINQAEVAERNQRVQLMTDIFSKAVEVICWPSNSVKEMKLITEAMEKWHNDPSKHGIALRTSNVILTPRKIGKAEKALSYADYWHRIWIQQELLLAQEVTILSDTTSLDWDDLAYDFLHGSKRWRSTNLRSLVERRKAIHTEPYLTFREAITQTQQCRSSDPRDLLFALMSLTHKRERIPIDYKMPKEKLWWLVMRMVTIEAQLPLTQTYSPLEDLNSLLYSSRSRSLGIDDEKFRDYIRDYVAGFWMAWGADRNMTLAEYASRTEDPYERWKRWKARRFHFYANQLYLLKRILFDFFYLRNDVRKLRYPWYPLVIMVCIWVIFVLVGILVWLSNHSAISTMLFIIGGIIGLATYLRTAGSHLRNSKREPQNDSSGR